MNEYFNIECENTDFFSFDGSLDHDDRSLCQYLKEREKDISRNRLQISVFSSSS